MTDRNLEARDLFGDAVGSTLVTALYARARGAALFDVTDWDDPQAREAWSALDTMGRERGRRLEDLVLTDVMNVVGTIRRSQDIDARVREFAVEHGHAEVVTLGVGMCNRAARLDGLCAEWTGVDNPDVVALRSRILPDDATRLVAGSVTGRDWLAETDPDSPTVLVAEGLLMYLTRPLVTQLLTRIGDHFTGPTRLVADVHHAAVARMPNPIAKRTGAGFHFGATSPQGFARLSPGWRLAGVDETMTRIRPAAARASRVFRTVSRSLMYGVVTIEREQERDGEPEREREQ
ncbi:class I SAM-dependent methyltransferase [Streptomyces nanshensis]|uniref:class I SAM-dependent methyltransferase n=1 Tax=Streptomyces nanshensis TaxID=518642 RepID=UPI00085C0A5B|nr:class I SAM-dependent methyltransferase [Streptomyces nanshensis]